MSEQQKFNINDFTFISGSELEDGSLLIAAQDNNYSIRTDPHTIFLLRSPDGTWKEYANTGQVSTGVSSNAKDNGISSLDPWGQYIELRLDGHNRINVFEDFKTKNPPTQFRFAKSIHGKMYVGGTNNYLYQLDGEKWIELSTEEMKTVIGMKSIENISGFNQNELYTFGWKGSIWTNSGGQWSLAQTPTEYILNDGDILGEQVFVGGQVGLIMMGRGDTFRLIENNILKSDIWSVKTYNDAVYFATISGILCLKDNKLSMFKQLDSDMRTSMILFTGPSGLWSIGASDINLFNGEHWKSIAKSDS